MPANYEATRYDFDGAFLTGIQGVNTGIVVPWGSASIPSGFLECNGQAVSRSTYAALFAVVGTSLVVYPAAGLVNCTAEETPVFVVDKKIPPIKAGNRLKIFEQAATEGMMALQSQLLSSYK